MQADQTNLYEQAFECFLTENKLPFIWIDQSKRPEFQDGPVKNFDFLLYPESDSPLLVELKGRTFKGNSLSGLKGLDAWTTFEDIQSLQHWHTVFAQEKPQSRAVFVFAFQFANIDVETDGLPVYDWADKRFLFLVIGLDKYARAMKVRSPKWQTVTLPAEDFRRWAKPINEALKR